MWLHGPAEHCPNLPCELTEREYVIGRGSDCSIVLRDLSVSRRHARLTVMAEGQIQVEDLSSRNGIVVNGVSIKNSLCGAGDVLVVGAVNLVFASSPLSTVSCNSAPSTAKIRREDHIFEKCKELSQAQQKVLTLLLDGLDERQIAGTLDCSHRTVHNHIQAVYRKLSVHSRQQLLALFVG